MINTTCGWDVQRQLTRRSGCGIWVGFQPIPIPPYLPIEPREPHFRQGVAYRSIAFCPDCIKGFAVKHLGFGLLVRPMEESDNVPAPAGPKLLDLYP